MTKKSPCCYCNEICVRPCDIIGESHFDQPVDVEVFSIGYTVSNSTDNPLWINRKKKFFKFQTNGKRTFLVESRDWNRLSIIMDEIDKLLGEDLKKHLRDTLLYQVTHANTKKYHMAKIDRVSRLKLSNKTLPKQRKNHSPKKRTREVD